MLLLSGEYVDDGVGDEFEFGQVFDETVVLLDWLVDKSVEERSFAMASTTKTILLLIPINVSR